MQMPFSELLDRYSILLLKKERLPENKEIEKECEKYHEALSSFGVAFDHLVEDMKEINGKIWDLESDIRRGKEKELGLEEVGRRALMIRDLNSERIKRKNKAALPHEFKEIKIDHASSTEKKSKKKK